MRHIITSFKSSKLLLLTILAIVSTSCASYQSANDDGIYTSEKKEPRVIIANSDEYKEHEENYFTSEVARLDRVNGTDILTDIDSYSSLDEEDELIIENDSLDYRPNGAWGTDNTTTVVVINNGFNSFDDLWWDWRWNNWRWNRWNRWNRWGYAGNWGWGFNNFGFYDPYFAFNGYYNPYFCPPFYNGFGFYGPYRGNRLFNNRFYRNGRRNGFLASNTRRFGNSRRNYIANTRRATTSRRSTSTIRRNSSIRNNRTRSNRIRSNNTRIRTRSSSTRTRGTRSTPSRTRSSSTRTRRTRSAPSRTRSSSTRSRSRGSSSRGSSSRGSSRGKRG